MKGLVPLLLLLAPALHAQTIAAVNSSQQSTNSTTQTVALPSGITSGDLLIVFMNPGAQATGTWPAGWTSL